MMKFEVILQVSSHRELISELSKLDVDVPLRSEGRKTVHVERSDVVRLLATLPATSLSFPLTLTHSDRPDFLLNMSDIEIGIEHTEAVPQNVAKAELLREREGLGSEVYFIPHVLPGEPEKTTQQLRAEILADEVHKGWAGDSAEREWAKAMASVIEQKLPKAIAPDFKRYPFNWLVVYDNWPLPAIKYSLAAHHLAPVLRQMDAFFVFDSIFVQDDSKLCELRPKECLVHALNSI